VYPIILLNLCYFSNSNNCYCACNN